MTELSYFWGGTTTGDATSAPYSDDEFSDFIQMLTTVDRTRQGVVVTTHPTYSSMLAVTNAGGSTARVPNGAAFVDGKLYINTANVDFTVSGASVWWLIGLKKDFAAQTVRAFSRGSYATRAIALAALVQTDGTTWEIPLGTVLTTAGGAVSSITDERQYVVGSSSGMVKINETIVGAGGGQIDWQNIPASYRNLTIVFSARDATSDSSASSFAARMRFNNDSVAANYQSHYTRHNPSATTVAYNYDGGSLGFMEVGEVNASNAAAYHVSSGTINIPNYRGTTLWKAMNFHSFCQANTSNSDYETTGGGIWKSTAAINRIAIFTESASKNFSEGSAFSLYGIP